MSISSTPASVNHLSAAQLPRFILPDYQAFVGKTYKKTPDAIQWVRHIPGWRSCHTELFTIIRAVGNRPIGMTWLVRRYNSDTRQVERLLREMEAAGWLHVERRTTRVGKALPNVYDFTPAIVLMGEIAAKMEAEEEADEEAIPPVASPASEPPSPVAQTPSISPVQDARPYEKVLTYLENDIEVSVPPTPVAQVMEPSTDEEATARPQARFDADYQALVDPLAAIGEELGDQAHPLASTTRAYKLMTAARLDVGPFLALVEEARLHTLAAIQARRRNKPPKVDNPMAYYFGVLARLTQPDKHPPQWRTGPPRERPAAVLPPSSPPSNTWEAVTAEAVQIMTPENVARWFTSAHQVEHVGDVLIIAVSDDFHRQWLDGRLRRSVDRCASSVQPGLQVRFIVKPSTPPLDQAL